MSASGGALMGSRGQSSVGTVAVAILALVQAALGILRALEWIRIGSDLAGRGLVLVPLLGAAAIGRGVVVGAVAALYALFAWGVLRGRESARWVGFVASLLTVLLVGLALMAGEPPVRVVFWLIVPAIVVAYGLSGRR